MLKKWEELPEDMRTVEVRDYYEILSHRQVSLLIKRIFDVIVALAMLIVLYLMPHLKLHLCTLDDFY